MSNCRYRTVYKIVFQNKNFYRPIWSWTNDYYISIKVLLNVVLVLCNQIVSMWTMAILKMYTTLHNKKTHKTDHSSERSGYEPNGVRLRRGIVTFLTHAAIVSINVLGKWGSALDSPVDVTPVSSWQLIVNLTLI